MPSVNLIGPKEKIREVLVQLLLDLDLGMDVSGDVVVENNAFSGHEVRFCFEVTGDETLVADISHDGNRYRSRMRTQRHQRDRVLTETWIVEMEISARGTIEVEADSEEDAMAIAIDQGCELRDINEIESSQPLDAERVNALLGPEWA